MSVMKRVALGIGNLGWHRHERVSDRYGTVNLSNLDDSDTYVRFDDAPIGEDGDLVAVVLETRLSAHIGDVFRGFRPSTPEVGDEITLGSGSLFVEESIHVGLMPDDDRDSDWLDPEALYRCSDQTVRLEFRAKGQGDR